MKQTTFAIRNLEEGLEIIKFLESHGFEYGEVEKGYYAQRPIFDSQNKRNRCGTHVIWAGGGELYVKEDSRLHELLKEISK